MRPGGTDETYRVRATYDGLTAVGSTNRSSRIRRGASISGARQGSPPSRERRNRTRVPVDPHADDAMDRDTYGGRINSAANRTTDLPDRADRQVPKLFGGRWNRSGRVSGDG